MVVSLDELKGYKNEAVVQRFLESWDLPVEEAEDLFDEMKKWLWLVNYCREQPPEERVRLAISPATKLIDEMWHTFILFSKDYCQFCEQYFGSYIHHVPTPRSAYDQTIARYEQDSQAVLVENRELFAKQYRLILDQLGEATLVKWYDKYLEKYPDERLRSVWRWSFSPYDTRVKDQVRAVTGTPPSS